MLTNRVLANRFVFALLAKYITNCVQWFVLLWQHSQLSPFANPSRAVLNIRNVILGKFDSYTINYINHLQIKILYVVSVDEKIAEIQTVQPF